MKNKSAVPTEGIEITRQPQDKRVAISQGGVEIKRESKPVSFEIPEVGFVYLIVDCSGSMAGDKLNQAKRGALNFAKDALMKSYLTGLIQFESFATHVCEPQREISVLEQHLKKMKIGGSTNMAEAIQVAARMLKNRKGSRVMVVITDGMPDSQEDTFAAAQQAKKNGIEIIAIGTDDADQKFLRKLASRTNLGVKVPRKQFEKGITSAAKMLPQLGPGRKGR